MDKIKFGNTDEQVSKLCLGTMYYGTKVDKATSFELLDRYMEKGGTFLDSANKYSSWLPGFKGGESELVLGEWMKQRSSRNQLFISSKVGFPYEDIPRTLKADVIISECERSLKRMEIETIDLYFAHAYDANTPIEESMEAFSRLKQQGKIRYAGASNFYSWRLAQANEVAKQNQWPAFECLQQRHTYLEPSLRANFGNQLLLTEDVEDYCRNEGIMLMAYSPLLGGAYSRKDVSLPFQYQSANTENRMAQLADLAGKLKLTVNQLVLAWMLNGNPPVLPVISASTQEQLDENIEAADILLSREDVDFLNKVQSHLS